MSVYVLDLPAWGSGWVIASLPYLCLALAVVIILALEALQGERSTAEGVPVVAGLAAVMAGGCVVWGGYMSGSYPFASGGLLVDGESRGFALAILISLAISSLVAGDELEARKVKHKGEFYALLLTASLGMLLVASTGSLMMFFLGLELFSLALYLLCIYFHWDRFSQEAGLKYFFLSSAASAVTLYGITFIYGSTGSTQLPVIAQKAVTLTGPGQAVLLAGIAMVLVGLLFKLSVVPFHQWTPEVYVGAPVSATAFMSVATKAAVLAFLIRFRGVTVGAESGNTGRMLMILAVASVFLGSILALGQVNLRRMLAFSSVVHGGILLLAPLVGGDRIIIAVMFYLIVYAFLNSGAFAALSVLENKVGTPLNRDGLQGGLKRYPLAGVTLAVCLIGLAGLPPTGGLLAKLYLFGLAVTNQKFLVSVAVVASFLGIYYYLMPLSAVLKSEVLKSGDTLAPKAEVSRYPLSWSARGGLLFTLLGVLFTGIYPTPLLSWLSHMTIAF